MKLDAERIDFSIVHRLGPFTQGRSRCIIARFIRRSDAIKVKDAAVSLRGTRYGIAEDLPTEWAAIRRDAYPKYVKPAKENKKRIRWQGNRLFIAGEEINLENNRGQDGKDVNKPPVKFDSSRTLTQSRVSQELSTENSDSEKEPDTEVEAETSTEPETEPPDPGPSPSPSLPNLTLDPCLRGQV